MRPLWIALVKQPRKVVLIDDHVFSFCPAKSPSGMSTKALLVRGRAVW